MIYHIYDKHVNVYEHFIQADNKADAYRIAHALDGRLDEQYESIEVKGWWKDNDPIAPRPDNVE